MSTPGRRILKTMPRQTRSSPNKRRDLVASPIDAEDDERRNSTNPPDSPRSMRRVVTKSRRYHGDDWVDSARSPVKVKSEANSRTSTPSKLKKSPIKQVKDDSLKSSPKPKPTKVHCKKSPNRKHATSSTCKPKVKVARIKEIECDLTDDEERLDDFGESLEEEALDLLSLEPPEDTSPLAKEHTIRPSSGELSQTLRDGLRQLKNLLKLPKARRWVFCELFYSEIDRQLFLGKNEFQQCLRESFPNLECTNMTRSQWHHIRKLIGKPRRCSQAFFKEEMESLDQKQSMLREIYRGTCIVSDDQLALLPELVKPLLTVGAKVVARIRTPKDGLYMGTVDAVLGQGYRIAIDKDVLPPQIVLDTELMADRHQPPVPLMHLIDKAKAKAFPAMRTMPNLINMTPTKHEPLMGPDPLLTASTSQSPRFSQGPRFAQSKLTTNDKVGNFPGKLLVILVKVSKLLSIKRSLVNQLRQLNSEAEKMNLMLTHSYPKPFQERYAQVVVDLEALNLQLEGFLRGMSEYRSQLIPHASQVPVGARPEALERLCGSQSAEIVRHCNSGLHVNNKSLLDLITSLTSLLLQMRSLGQTNGSPLELSTLSSSLTHIKASLHPSNVASFQDHIEVHMKHIHSIMLAANQQSHLTQDSVFR